MEKVIITIKSFLSDQNHIDLVDEIFEDDLSVNTEDFDDVFNIELDD